MNRVFAPGATVATADDVNFLHDDLDDVSLGADLIREPPVDLWPTRIKRRGVPADLAAIIENSDRAIRGANHSAGCRPPNDLALDIGRSFLNRASRHRLH